jgi:hypothetical protein
VSDQNQTVTPGSESGTDFSESGPDQRPRRKTDALAGMRRDRNGPSMAQKGWRTT